MPKSALNSDCKVVYICREPKDAFVSQYHFLNKLSPKKISLEKAFDLFCEGKCHCGPNWDHVLGFWKASQENTEKVLFLKYEDMVEDTAFYVKRLAEFMGYNFSLEEEKQGAVQKELSYVVFRMGNLEVNKVGLCKKNVANKIFFGKDKVGD